MRTPTPDNEAYAYWFSVLNGTREPVHEDNPQAGFYRMRLVKNGPFVPVAIWIEKTVDETTGELLDDERYVALVNGKPEDPARIWTYCAARPIEEDEYRYHLEMGQWAAEHQPDHPAAHPRKPINLLNMEPVV